MDPPGLGMRQSFAAFEAAMFTHLSSAESLLAQSLEQDQGDAVGQVKRARIGIKHGDPKPAILVSV